jgi:hypothetical protein
MCTNTLSWRTLVASDAIRMVVFPDCTGLLVLPVFATKPTHLEEGDGKPDKVLSWDEKSNGFGPQPTMVLIACAGWATNHFSGQAFPNRSDISSMLG